jgi:hypothetical protein
MPSIPLGSEDSLPKDPGAASIPGDPFPWAPEAGQERAAAPTDPVPELPPMDPDEDLFPRDLGEVD